jgi:xanthine dehydrogenase YagR molybdenum-binding subunit
LRAEEIELADGGLRARADASRRAAVETVLARRGQPIEAVVAAKPGEAKKQFSIHSFGAHFVELHVDPDLGEIRVARYVGAFAAGRIMNAKTARSQMIGGIVYGLGMALLEHTWLDRRAGRIVNASIAEYLVPVHADVPEIEIVLIDEPEDKINALGAKGMGELPMVGVAAAVANAIYHATGKRVRDLPITIDKLIA